MLKNVINSTELKKLRDKNRMSQVGADLTCPICNHLFKKKTYQQIFCSIRCKDKSHNIFNSDRHKDSNYYKKYNKKFERISPIRSFNFIPTFDDDTDVDDMLDINDFGTYYGDQD